METQTAPPAAKDTWCPLLDVPCPNGPASAAECHRRVEGDFNPLHNWRDLAILCCADDRRTSTD
ncbi:MAG: hypothetical protein K9N46_01185 [Candidatus Marinimicrobia bacterium]|nr:hypothetical protein [Candidatus Neomarinimicrobiota bacterium]MCF7827910.1 hypothetical protein [Candidatus Neomarinimicrobiota bacterium]MCF7879335.1 hypothetical protein [Candidatus Neomarinimicrobiota bacterium]